MDGVTTLPRCSEGRFTLCTFTERATLFTGGEDSIICVWEVDGKLI